MFNGVYDGKRVLVTGNTGFKGSWLTIWLHMLGAKVAGIADTIPTQPSNYEVSGLSRFLNQYFVDVRDLSTIENAIEAFQPDIVFHLAAQSLVRESLTNPLLTFETNTQGTLNILETLRRQDTPIPAVIITSDKCYRNVEWVWGYRETDELGGDDPYSASKGAAELIFRSYSASYDHVVATTVRAGNVIGGGDWAQDRIVPDCMRAWSKEEVPLIRHPFATRPWQHVLEPLSGYLWLGALLYQDPQRYRGESYNFGPNSSSVYSVRDLLEQIGKHWPGAVWQESEGVENVMDESTFLKLSSDKALSQLQWKTFLDIEQAAKMTVDWYLAYQKRSDMFQYCCDQIDSYAKTGAGRKIVWAEDGK